MAQTKKRAAPKRSSKTQAKSRGSTKSKASTAKPGSKSRSTSSKSRPASKRRSTAAKSRSSNGASAHLDSARHTVEDKAKSAGETAKDAGHTVGKAASKAKVPLIAGGAALAGAAGGLALAASRQDRHRRLAASMRKPRIKLNSHKPLFKVNSDDVTKAAKEVGNFGAQVGELAAELQRNRETAHGSNGSKHRSPIEVVLEGLTSRR